LALECPVCGLTLARQALPRPLLFQASALQTKPVQESRKTAVSAPAWGRVTPVVVDQPDTPYEAHAQALSGPPPASALPARTGTEAMTESFWPLVRLEITEAGILLCINGILILLVSWMAGAGPMRIYGELWPFLLPVHFAISWAFEMVPITLVGQSPFMGSLGLLLDSVQPERRIAFSLFHLISVLLFPLSFLCMILTPYHRTLAEVLTGQEILSRPMPRMR
jgi:hypothetical protein